MNTLSALLGLAFCFACLPHALAATATPGAPHPCAIRVTGPIDARTPAALEAAIRKEKAGPCKAEDAYFRRQIGTNMPAIALPLYQLVLQIIDSPGGDLMAAMEAGRIIRRELVNTVIPINATCASACVLMYLGGVTRRATFGRLGLHRPYSLRDAQSLSDSQELINRMTGLTKAYLEEMNIPLRLLDIMNSIPSDEIRWLPETEQDVELMKELLLVGDDPAFADLRDSDHAKIWGLTKAEYYERNARAIAACKNVKDYHLCYAKFMKGTR
jgi:hypothetical protein